MAGKVTAGLAESNAAYRRVYDMHVCHCGPGGRWCQPTTRLMIMQADCGV